MTDLLPCPFCGGTPYLANVEMVGCSYVVCTDCRTQSDDMSKDRAIAAWNTHPPTPAPNAGVVKVNTEQMYLICKYGGYYRANCRGYTSSPAEDGRYTMADAERETHPNGPDGPRDGMSYIPAPEPTPDPRDAVIARLVEALEDIARQKTSGQIERTGETEFSDFEGAYDMCIEVARAALAAAKEVMK